MSFTFPKDETRSLERSPLALQRLDTEGTASHIDRDRLKVKDGGFQPYLDAPVDGASNRSFDLASTISSDSTDNEHGSRSGRQFIQSDTSRLPSRSPMPVPKTCMAKARDFWAQNKGLFLVTAAQVFGVLMSVTTKLLEMSGPHGPGMHPLQILFARMVGTLILSVTYQWMVKVEKAPFGPKEVLSLLIARGIGGFFGVYGMYYSLQYLPLSDATVITFLAPIVTSYTCSILIHEPFTRSEQVAGLISFFGVVLIARSTSVLPGHSSSSPAASGSADGLPSTNGTSEALDPQHLSKVTPSQRLSAVGVALVGVLGATCAYTTIRWIGKRAHPLISVNYFAAWSAIVSCVALLVVPNIGFALPASLRQWIYLISLGACGFVMQFLLTAGLQYEKGSRATNMVYTQMLFALAFDKIVWNTTPGMLSIAGSSMILGSALYVALLSNKGTDQKEGSGASDIEASARDSANDGAGDGREPLRGVQEVQLRTLRV